MLMQKLQQERLVCAAGALFEAENILDLTITHCKANPIGGKPLSKFQSTQFSLVEMASEIRILRTFVETLVVDHMAEEQIIKETSMAKYWVTDMSKRVASQCLDIMGSDGVLETCPLARRFRDTRVTSIFAGTNEIMKSIIAKVMGL